MIDSQTGEIVNGTAAVDFTQPIEIVSGEGEEGTVERYDGTGSLRALKSRLTRERCNGDRWAFARYVGGERIVL